MLQKLRSNKEGFTLIELMIVIAIIGILAAIAIPNFIAYRDRSYCSAVESDAQAIAGYIAGYFSEPTNVTVSSTAVTAEGFSPSNNNGWSVAGPDANGVYTITVSDGSGRCPRFNTVTITM
jgi:prepilin-type N-terminal cleavage/methylation domain-containing protein